MIDRRQRWSRPLAELGPAVAVFFAVVVLAAGISSMALLVAPGSTDRYFSWNLRPTGAAALIGGFYLASAALFGWALTLPWREARPLLVGVLGLAVPTLVLTVIHDEVFDFGRWQAVAWVVLFATAPVSATLLLVRGRHDPPAGRNLRTWSRATLAGLALVLMAVAVLIWLVPTRDHVARYSPVALKGLTGTYLGAWCSFLALLLGWAATRGRWDQARVPLVALALAAAGALLALVRAAGEVQHRPVALTAAGAVLVVAVAVYVRENRASDVSHSVT